MPTDIHWDLLLQIMKNTGRIYNTTEHRMTFKGMLYRMRTGIPWRDLPLNSESGARFTGVLIFGQEYIHEYRTSLWLQLLPNIKS